MEAQHIVGIALIAFIIGWVFLRRAIGQAREQLFTPGSVVVAALYVGMALVLAGGYAGVRTYVLGISPVAAQQQKK